jgi:DNA polymerase V
MATYYILADINAAYVSFCAMFNPQLKNRPMGVLSSNQGNVIARNQELKNLGVKMAAAAYEVKPIVNLHGGHLWGSNFTLFGDMSERFHTELEFLIIDACRYSVDEAFGLLDTSCMLDTISMSDLKAYATHIQSTIKQNLGLDIGVGVGRTKTLAKVASWASKQKKWSSVTKGVVVLDSEEKEQWVLSRIGVNQVWGCGAKTTVKLESHNILNGMNLRDSDLKFMQQKYGVLLEKTILELRGINAIELADMGEARQQICVSRSMGVTVESLSILNSAISSHTRGFVTIPSILTLLAVSY